MIMNKFKKVAVFHCSAHVGSAWACAEGIVTTLQKMGLHVLDCARPINNRYSIADLMKTDLIILSAPEWYYEQILECYGLSWFDLKAKKIAWFAESAQRDDRNFPFSEVLKLVDEAFYPAIQDASEFGGHWMPFGVDIDIFKPLNIEKIFDVSFIGSMYPKRLDFVKNINFPVTHIQSLSDPNIVKSFELLTQAYNSTKIFLNLPALSRLLVTKVTEVMACGTLLFTPKLDHPSSLANLNSFQDGVELIYYDPTNTNELRKLLQYYVGNPLEANSIAQNGYQKVVSNFTLESQLSKILTLIQPADSRRKDV